MYPFNHFSVFSWKSEKIYCFCYKLGVLSQKKLPFKNKPATYRFLSATYRFVVVPFNYGT